MNTYLALKQKHPDHVPVIVLPASLNVTLKKNKYLVHLDTTMGKFLYEIRKECKLAPETAIFLFVNDGFLVPTSSTLRTVYDRYRNPRDGFLYLKVTSENTFGFFF